MSVDFPIDNFKHYDTGNIIYTTIGYQNLFNQITIEQIEEAKQLLTIT